MITYKKSISNERPSGLNATVAGPKSRKKQRVKLAQEVVNVMERNKEALLSMIKDAYTRMATNRDADYRAIQMGKVNKWLEELTIIEESI